MSTPGNASGRIVSFTCGSAVGICQGFDWEFDRACEEIFDEDSIIVDALPTRRNRVFINVVFLHSPPASSDAAQTGTLVERIDAGGTLTTALGSLKLVNLKKSKGKDGAAQYAGRFQCVGATAQPAPA
jgi:hypothetical protein